MDKGEDIQEIFESRTEALGVDVMDFIMSDATYIRIQLVVRGKIKVIPEGLVNKLAQDIREYDVKKEVK
jgi:hypothetical protein